MTPASIGILMVVSPGEADLAGDSLHRALECAPTPCTVYLINNGGVEEPASWWAALGQDHHRLEILAPELPSPRPYFEYGRTIFGGLRRIAVASPELIFRFDPDTLVLEPGF